MKKRTLLLNSIAALLISQTAFSTTAPEKPEQKIDSDECVILLHGLGRSGFSMKAVEWRLNSENYQVVNQSYPSTQHPIEELAELAFKEALPQCNTSNSIHFVTHSLGGILLRQYLAKHELENLGRAVMLGPPNQGSQLADYIASIKLADTWQPQAGKQLGTDERSVPKQLGPVDFEVGVIAGNRNWRPLVSKPLVGPSDGTVTVEETKVAGMRDFLELPATHTMMMWQRSVLDQIVVFLENGEFDHSESPESNAR